MGIVATGLFSLIDSNDGVNLTLSRASAVIPTLVDGSGGDFSQASTTAAVWMGGVDDTLNWSFQIVPSSGVSGTASNSNRTYTVTAMTNATGYVDFIATKLGFTQLLTRFTLVKAPQGERGTIVTSIAVSATSWSDATAATAIANAGGGSPIRGDVVTQYNKPAEWSQTRVRLSNGTWAALAAFFGGDVLVDGTLAATALVSNSLTTTQIQAGGVNADRLMAGTIYAGLIASGAIVSRHLSVADMTNLIPNGDFSDPYISTVTTDTWDNASNGTLQFRSDFPDKSPYSLLLQKSSTTVSSNVVMKAYIPVDPAELYYASVRYWTNSGTAATAGCYYRLQWYNKDKAYLSFTDVVNNQGFSTTVKEEGKQIIPPAGAYYARVQLYNHSTQTVTTNLFFGAITLRRMLQGKLIVDGTIYGNHLAANIVTTKHLNVADMTNFAGAFNMNDQSFWSNPTTTTYVAASASWASSHLMRLQGGSTTYVTNLGQTFEVEAGSKLFLSYQAQVAAGTGFIYMDVQFSASDTFSSPTYMGVGSTTSTAVTLMSGEVTVPAGMHYARIRAVKGNNGVTDCYFGSVTLRKKSAGHLIVDGTIEGNHIASDTMEARHLKAKIVSADKLLIGDTSNMLPDWSQGSLAGWNTQGQLAWSNDTAAGAASGWKLTSNAKDQARPEDFIQVSPGETYYFSAWVYNSATEAAQLVIHTMTPTGGANIWTSIVATNLKDSWVKLEGIATIPSGHTQLRVILNVAKSSTGGNNTSWTKPVMRRAASGEIIVDGSIEGKHVKADTIDAGHLKAGIIDASKVRIGDFTNLNVDKDFEFPALWADGTGTRTYTASPSEATYGGKNYLAVGGGSTLQRDAFGPKFQVREGDVLLITAYLWTDNTGHGRINLRVANNPSMSSPTLIAQNAAGEMETNANTPQRMQGFFTVPAGMTWAQLSLRKRNNTVTNAYFSGITVQRATTGELITGSVKSDNYSAGLTGWNIDKNGDAEFNNLTVRNILLLSGVKDLATLNYPAPTTWTQSAATTRGTIALGPVVAADLWFVNFSAGTKAYAAGSGKTLTTFFPVVETYIRYKTDGVWSGWSGVAWFRATSTVWRQDNFFTTIVGTYDDVEIRISTTDGWSGGYRNVNLSARKL